MHKLYEDVKRELREIDENGITANNLEAVYKLVDIAKDLCEIKKCEEEEMEKRGRHSGYGNYSYMDRSYEGYGIRDGRRDDYDPYGNSYPKMRYNNVDPRMTEFVNRIMEDSDMYAYGRQKYRESGNRERMHDGLDKLMYSICAFVKGIEEFAETPEEKEIVRKHIQNLRVG